MGKYMRRNSKTTGEVSLMDIPSHAGVRTRAKTLALQKAASNSASAVAISSSAAAASYIQLRSRRLVKPTLRKRQKENRVPPKPDKHSLKGLGSSSLNLNSGNSSSVKKLVDGEKLVDRDAEIRVSEDSGMDDEASFGENNLEIGGRESCGRSTRETTPCNLIRDPEAISSPGSTTKRAYSVDGNYRVRIPAPRHIPSTIEMDEFFTEPEKQQQQVFIDKYNFDPVNEKPLPGKYEWVKVDGASH